MPYVYKKYEKNNTWNIRLLVDDSFVPSSKQPSVIYCRLTDFMSVFIGILVHCLALLKLESVLYKNYRQNIEEAPLYIHHLNTWVYIKSHNLMVLELLIASRRFAFL